MSISTRSGNVKVDKGWNDRDGDGTGDGGYLLILHFGVLVEFFMTCLTEHFTENLSSISIYKFNIIPLIRPKPFRLLSITRTSKRGVLQRTEPVLDHWTGAFSWMDRWDWIRSRVGVVGGSSG